MKRVGSTRKNLTPYIFLRSYKITKLFNQHIIKFNSFETVFAEESLAV